MTVERINATENNGNAVNETAAASIPAEISTAHLLLRGLLPAFLGCSIESVRPSAFQMTFRKEKHGDLTGKLSWNLGKKYGMEFASNLLPTEDHQNCGMENPMEHFWELLEKAANDIIQNSNNNDIDNVGRKIHTGGALIVKNYCYPSEDAALLALEMGILDAGQLNSREKRCKKKDKKGSSSNDNKISNNKDDKEMEQLSQQQQPVYVGHILGSTSDASSDTNSTDPTYSLALLHGSTLLPLSNLGTLKILRTDPKNESNIVCNKKKCEVTVKFCVCPTAANIGRCAVVAEEGPTDRNAFNMSHCLSMEIREVEGRNFLDYMQRITEEVTTTTTTTKDITTNTLKDSIPNDPSTAATIIAPDNSTSNNDDMVVTAFEVSGTINYSKLIEKFGSKPLTPYLLKRLENVTVKRGTVDKLHRFLRREIFFSHRDLERICELLEGWYGVSPPLPLDQNEECPETEIKECGTPLKPTTTCPIYLYTGRGPSSAAMHLGHLVPFLFTAWLQRAFQCPLVIQMTDDEKFLFKGTYTGEDTSNDSEENNDGGEDSHLASTTTTSTDAVDPNQTGDNLNYFANLTIENAKDIIACDFIKEKTFLFSDLDYVGKMYPNIVRIWKAITVNQVNGVFGFNASSNIGKVAFPAIQAAPSFGSSFPIVLGGGGIHASAATLGCLIPCAIDQDPYFRLTRDIAHKLVPRQHPLQGKPSLIHSKFFPPLQGAQGKMSSSDSNSAIFLTDTPEEIERKIKVHAFSGGQETKKLQEELGANLEVDVSYQWLRFFLEDDQELERIGREYGSGKGEYWSTGKVKTKLAEVLQKLVAEHQERRKTVSLEVVREWMEERCIL